MTFQLVLPHVWFHVQEKKAEKHVEERAVSLIRSDWPVLSSDQMGLMLQDKKADKRDKDRICPSHDHDEQMMRSNHRNAVSWWMLESNSDAGQGSRLRQGLATRESRRGELFTFPVVCCNKTISVEIRADLIGSEICCFRSHLFCSGSAS